MKVVIIGAGPAGVTVAEELLMHRSGAEIVMISSEPFPPYSPPAMVEYFTQGRQDIFWKGKDFPADLPLTYMPGTRVEKVLPERRSLQLSNGDALNYDYLVLASGSHLYAPLVGEDREGIYDFKSLSSARELMDRVKEGSARTALIVGAGFVGVEVALILADLGLDTTQLVRSRVMRSMLDEELSGMVQEIMKKRGVKVLQGEDSDAVAFEGQARVEGVRTRSGKVIKADLVIAATGLRPNISYLEGTGVEVEWGVLVDDRQRTNFATIYAAGDVAVTENRITGRRFAHGNLPNAVAQARVVAANLMGWDMRYTGSDSMNSLKHLGVRFFAVGAMEGEELRVRRGDTLRKIYVQNGRITGFRLFGDISGAGIYRSLMNRGADISAFKDRLLTPGFGMGYVESQSAVPTLL